jgi:hypothetical protein
MVLRLRRPQLKKWARSKLLYPRVLQGPPIMAITQVNGVKAIKGVTAIREVKAVKAVKAANGVRAPL